MLGTSPGTGITTAYSLDHNKHLVSPELCLVSVVVRSSDSVSRNNERSKQGFYLCNADCIMLIMTKITLHRLIPLEKERKPPPVS